MLMSQGSHSLFLRKQPFTSEKKKKGWEGKAASFMSKLGLPDLTNKNIGCQLNLYSDEQRVIFLVYVA